MPPTCQDRSQKKICPYRLRDKDWSTPQSKVRIQHIDRHVSLSDNASYPLLVGMLVSLLKDGCAPLFSHLPALTSPNTMPPPVVGPGTGTRMPHRIHSRDATCMAREDARTQQALSA
eukprot:631534-Pelagomonas_calceolata.AAC.3